jgi:hypothetical protein
VEVELVEGPTVATVVTVVVQQERQEPAVQETLVGLLALRP